MRSNKYNSLPLNSVVCQGYFFAAVFWSGHPMLPKDVRKLVQVDS